MSDGLTDYGVPQYLADRHWAGDTHLALQGAGLEISYRQAVNKRLSNLARKLERERKAAQTHVDKLTQEKLGWESTNRSRNEYIAGLKKENAQLQTYRSVASCTQAYAEANVLRTKLAAAERALTAAQQETRSVRQEVLNLRRSPTWAETEDLKAKLAAAERTVQTILELEKQANFRVGDLTREIGPLKRELDLTKAARDTQQHYATAYRATSNQRTKELAASKALTERWCKDFHDVNQDRITLQAAIKRHEAEIDSVLSKPKTALEQLRKDLAQAVAAKDAAVEQAKEWKRKYQDRKNLDFGLLYGASPIQVLSRCHDEITVSKEDAERMARRALAEFPKLNDFFKQPLTGFKQDGATSGRTQSQVPNLSNPPRSDIGMGCRPIPRVLTATLSGKVATHADGTTSKYKSNGVTYVVTEDDGTQYYWSFTSLLDPLPELTLHHTRPLEVQEFHPAHKNLTGDSFLTREDLDRARKACEKARPGLPAGDDQWLLKGQDVAGKACRLLHPDGTSSYVTSVKKFNPPLVHSQSLVGDIRYVWEMHRLLGQRTPDLLLKEWSVPASQVDRAIPGSEKTVVQVGRPVGDGKGFKALHEFDTPIKDALKQVLDTFKMEEAYQADLLKQTIDYINTPMTFLPPTTAEKGRWLHMYFQGMVDNVPAKPLTLKVKDVKIGDWLWHDATHPSRIYRLSYAAATGKILTAHSNIGSTLFDWKAQQVADCCLLVLEKTCK